MARKTHHTVQFRRKREGLTNYKKRMKLLLSGKPRLVVRRGNNSIITQIVEYGDKGDNVKSCAVSGELKKLGWKYNQSNVSGAYLTGLLLGKKAIKAGVKEAILDIGLYEPKKGSKSFAVLKGAVDAGLSIPHSDDKVPDEKRIKGEHISEYAGKVEDAQKRFSGYAKKGADLKSITSNFEETKNNILKI